MDGQIASSIMLWIAILCWHPVYNNQFWLLYWSICVSWHLHFGIDYVDHRQETIEYTYGIHGMLNVILCIMIMLLGGL